MSLSSRAREGTRISAAWVIICFVLGARSGRARGLGVLNGTPDAIGRRWHIHVRDPELGERVSNRVHHRGERAGATRFAAPLHAEHVGGGGYRMVDDRDLGRI